MSNDLVRKRKNTKDKGKNTRKTQRKNTKDKGRSSNMWCWQKPNSKGYEQYGSIKAKLLGKLISKGLGKIRKFLPKDTMGLEGDKNVLYSDSDNGHKTVELYTKKSNWYCNKNKKSSNWMAQYLSIYLWFMAWCQGPGIWVPYWVPRRELASPSSLSLPLFVSLMNK